MLGNLQLNTSLLGAGTPVPTIPVAASYDAVEFDGFSLQTSDIISSDVDAFSGPAREIDAYATPRADGGGLTGAYYRERTIRVAGTIICATAAILEARLDEIKRRLSTVEGYLSITPAGQAPRRVLATLRNPDRLFAGRQAWHVSSCPFLAEFVAQEPMFHAYDYDTLTIESVADLTRIFDFETLGSYDAQPVFIAVVSAAAAITGLTLTNETTGEAIVVTQTIAAGDVLTIDSEARSVTLNGVEIDYSGLFPRLAYGSNRLTAAAAGTSITYDLTIKAKKAYL